MKWRKTMKSNGFELNTYSKAIQAEAIRLEGLENEKNSLRKELASSPSEALEDEVSDIENNIDDLDNELVVKIKKYDKNREHYAMLATKLKDSREAKKQAKLNPTPEPIADPAPVDPIPEPIVDPALVDPTPEPIVDPSTVDEPKKKGGGGALLAIGLLVVGSIIGVNLLKKK